MTARPDPIPEDEANSGFSHDEEGDGPDDASSGDETSAPTATGNNDDASGTGARKRKRVKYQKTS